MSCKHCGIEVDRFGTGPWFHVDTMERHCSTPGTCSAAEPK